MKKKIIIVVILCMLFSLCDKQKEFSHTHTSHNHVQFTSSIEKTDCHLCGKRTDTPLSEYLGQRNLGIIDLNTFEVEPAPIFEYSILTGELVEEACGAMKFHYPVLDGTRMTIMTDSDRGYAQISVDKFNSKIDPDKISAFLCQTCLDTLGAGYFVADDPPALAVVDFSRREISPLIVCRPWYLHGEYMVDCDFEDDGGINLLFVYCPNRFEEKK